MYSEDLRTGHGYRRIQTIVDVINIIYIQYDRSLAIYIYLPAGDEDTIVYLGTWWHYVRSGTVRDQ